MATHDKAKEQGRQARDQTAKAVESNRHRRGFFRVPGSRRQVSLPQSDVSHGQGWSSRQFEELCRAGHRTQLHAFDTHDETETDPQV